MVGRNRQLGLTSVMRLVWTHGDAWSRCFAALYLGGLTTMVLVTGLLVWMIVTNLAPELFLFDYVLAEVPAALILQSVFLPAYNVSVVRERLRRGWARPQSRPYYEEFARYVEALGVKGRPKFEVAWGFVGTAAFVLILATSLLFTALLLPVLGSSTPILTTATAAGLGLGFYVGSVLRMRRLLLEAERQGYRLIELHWRNRGGLQASSR